MQTATTLLRAGKDVELAHFSAIADPFPQLIRLKLERLYKLRTFEDLAQEIKRQEAVREHPDWLKHKIFIHRLNSARHGLRLLSQDHAFFMNEVPNTWEEAMTNLSGPAKPNDPQSDLEKKAAALISLRNNPTDELEDFSRRLAWGQNMLQYGQFLGNINVQFRKNAVRNPAVQKMRQLIEQRNSAVVFDNLAPLLQAVEAGRSVLLSSAHAGMLDIGARLRLHIDLPQAMVGANATTSLQGGDRLTLGPHGNFQTDFLKLVKIVKKSPHQIRILPDGGLGGDRREFDLLGRKIQLGPGAATLAWHARAVTFFTGTRVEGSKIRVYLREGPVANKEMGREAFDQAFYEFYINCLKEIVLGAPENMVGQGGFWPYLMTKTI